MYNSSVLNVICTTEVHDFMRRKIEEKISPRELTKLAQSIDPRIRIKEGKDD